jgi:hypothetical protein
LGPSEARKGKSVNKSPPRRRPPKIDTERMACKRASARHLKDLRRAHKAPPADVVVNTRGIPKLVPPILEQSYCTSPAALCVELGESENLALEAALAQSDEDAALGLEFGETFL